MRRLRSSASCPRLTAGFVPRFGAVVCMVNASALRPDMLRKRGIGASMSNYIRPRLTEPRTVWFQIAVLLDAGPEPFVYRPFRSGAGERSGALGFAVYAYRVRRIERPRPTVGSRRLQDLVLDVLVLHGPASDPACSYKAGAGELSSRKPNSIVVARPQRQTPTVCRSGPRQGTAEICRKKQQVAFLSRALRSGEMWQRQRLAQPG